VSNTPQESERFRTFPGVFRPVVLTILGAMLYLRLGWLVGNSGLFGAIAVILCAYIITGATALSVSSIASNVRVRPGGAFAIIAGALGLEAGGAIGIPLYIAQASSTALYLYAFTEGWAVLFPTHNPMVVAGIGLIFVSYLAYRSATWALKAQGVMFILVILALVSAAGGLYTNNTLHNPSLLAQDPDVSILQAFAIFFPAATGIMIGVGMSGSLAKPRQAIPLGTMWAWAVTLVVYLLGAIWYATVASPEELRTYSTLAIDRSAIGLLVLLGLLVSTLMAALSSLVAAPRLLQAMAIQRVVPLADWLGSQDEAENPRNALFVTVGIAALALSTGSLNAVAPIITSFFIITYLAINLVVLLEHRLGMISFRPTFKVKQYSPLLGVITCSLAMVLASPRGGILEFVFVVGIYGFITGRKLETPWETVHSGIALSLADWATQKISRLERSQRAWKPDLLVPVHEVDGLHWDLPLVRALTLRNGSVKLIGIGNDPELEANLEQGLTILDSSNIFATSALVRDAAWIVGLRYSIELLKASSFPPNLLLFSGRDRDEEELKHALQLCAAHKLGLAMHVGEPLDLNEKPHCAINIWLSDRSPDWSMSLRLANIDLPVLVGLLLADASDGHMRLVTAIENADEYYKAQTFLGSLIDVGRLPLGTTAHVFHGDFLDQLENAPPADIHLFGISPQIDPNRLKMIQAKVDSLCIFLMDSGYESAIA
jgi:amino acid transporter